VDCNLGRDLLDGFDGYVLDFHSMGFRLIEP
jgi:hypothetical protein